MEFQLENDTFWFWNRVEFQLANDTFWKPKSVVF